MLNYKEADTASLNGSPMTIIGEPVKFGSVESALDLIMFTPIQNRPPLNNSDILDVFNEMSPLAFAYSFYCLLLVSIVLPIVNMAKRGSLSHGRAWCHFFKAIWSIVETVIDQENYQPIIVHAQIIWLFLNFFVFVFVCGYFLNLISVNQIAHQPPVLLEKISDFRNLEFQHVIPTMPKNFFFYEVLARSQEGTDLHYVYDRMMNEGNCTGYNAYNYDACNALTLDIVETPKYMEHAIRRLDRSLAKHDIALISAEILCDSVTTIDCLINPAKNRKNFLKTSSFMSGYLTGIYSHQISDPMFKILSFRSTSYLLEFGLLFKIVNEGLIDALHDKLSQFSANNQYFICMENRPEPNEIKPEPALFSAYINLITYCFYTIGLSCILLMMELITRPIQIRIAINKRRARQVRMFNRNRHKGLSTKPDPIEYKITFHTTNWRNPSTLRNGKK